MPHRHTLLTAADHRFARTLWQMLASAGRLGLPDAYRIVAIDLGMTPADRHQLTTCFRWCTLESFDAAAYPPHVADLSTFAWKPIAIANAASRASGLVLWFDSGTVFHEPLHRMLEEVAASGVYSLAGQTRLGDCCDPRTLDAIGATAADRREPYRAGGVLAFDPARPAVRAVLDCWRRYALDPNLIAPEGLDPRTHRFDQALLTAILCAARREHGLPIGPDEIDISSTHPVGFVSTRNKVPAWMPRAMDPLVRAYYAVWKRADRVVLRARAKGKRRAGSCPPAYQD